MKIAIICSSVLLKQALNTFLKDYVSSYKSCDFVVCDRDIDIEKPSFIISNKTDKYHLRIPFSKANLLIELEKYYKALKKTDTINQKSVSKEIDMDLLEYKISQACKEFENRIVDIVKEAYE